MTPWNVLNMQHITPNDIPSCGASKDKTKDPLPPPTPPPPLKKKKKKKRSKPTTTSEKTTIPTHIHIWNYDHISQGPMNQNNITHPRTSSLSPPQEPSNVWKLLCGTFGNQDRKYCQATNIKCTKSENLNVSRLILQLSLPIPLKPGVKSRMKCSWNSTDRRCSNYIWVINNFIAYKGAAYIRGMTVIGICWGETET